jgi:hypothetical protein
VVTLTREHGPPPQTKQPSGKAPLDVPGVGRLTWDDDLDWWQGEIIAQTGESASLHIEIEDETPERVAEAARRFVAWLAAHEPAARQFAANRLLDLHNDTWNDGDEISTDDFVSRMSLESAGWSRNGRANLYYRDGELFWGHCIIVTVDASGAFVDASIAG